VKVTAASNKSMDVRAKQPLFKILRGYFQLARSWFCPTSSQEFDGFSYFQNLCENERMTDQILLERITLNPKVMVGKPVIRGTRLTVEFILNLLAHGATTVEILDEYQGLTPEDIRACLLFARESLSRTEFMPLVMETT
jgi:uncharacterized protein (DUF433 family)